MKVNTRDLTAGAVFTAIGAFFSVNALLTLNVGTLSRMGPAYFPILTGLVLVGLGLTISIKSLGAPSLPLGRIPIRALILITLSPVVFAVLIRGAGLIAASLAAVVLAAYSAPSTQARTAWMLAIILTALCAVIFKTMLGLPIDLVGPWFGR